MSRSGACCDGTGAHARWPIPRVRPRRKRRERSFLAYAVFSKRALGEGMTKARIQLSRIAKANWGYPQCR